METGARAEIPVTFPGITTHTLRSRLTVSYATGGRIAPYVSCELFNSWSLDKVRYTFGADMRLGGGNTVGLFYRLQAVSGHGGLPGGNTHVLGTVYSHAF